MKISAKIGITTAMCMIISCLIFASVVFISNRPVAAANTSDFKPGNIMSDLVFIDSNSMSVGQIQSFLDSKGSVCLKNFSSLSLNDENKDGLGDEPYGKGLGEKVSAATLIWQASQLYNINPKVILATLQKEQGLITRSDCPDWRYNTALGYGCPDTAPCDQSAYGFTRQIDYGVWHFRGFFDDTFPVPPTTPGNKFIAYNPDGACGGTTINIQNRATAALYSYTPYQPNAASLAAAPGQTVACGAYGNLNFWRYFTDWFGNNSGPAAFMTAGSSTIYIPIEGYKLAVPYTAAMQDYGISLEAVRIVSQSYIDSTPSPPVATGISSSISHVIKSTSDSDGDGGSVYLVSRGKRYKLQSMQQFYNLGFNESDISYLPLSYIILMSDSGALSNFVTSPYGSVFKVVNNSKQIIFDYGTYIAQNPDDNTTPLSYYLINKIPSGNPITDRPVLIKNPDGESVSLYQNDKYYSIPDYNTFSCWGLSNSTIVPVYRIPQKDYIAAYAPLSILGCIVNDGQNNIILNSNYKYIAPISYGLSGVAMNADIKALSDRMPTRDTPLKQYIKSPDSAAVWDIENGKRKLIPSYSSFSLLGLNYNSVDIISQYIIDQIPKDGIKLADGQLVKEPSSAAIYVIANNKRVLFPSSELFLAYSNSWNSIETYSSDELSQYYPYSGAVVGDYLVNSSLGKAYIIGQNGCFELNDTTLSALGTDYVTLLDAQPYSSTIFISLYPSCSSSTNFIKLHGQDLVYWVNSGKKYALNTYSALLNKNGGVEPKVMELTQAIISSLITGDSYN